MCPFFRASHCTESGGQRGISLLPVLIFLTLLTLKSWYTFCPILERPPPPKGNVIATEKESPTVSTPTPDDSSVLFDAAYAESLRKLLDLADHVPLKTGILHHAFFTYTALWRHNGVDAHDPVTPLQWQSYYNALQSSARPGSRAAESLPPLDGITDKAKSYQDNGIIPLTVAHIHFEQPKASLALDEMMQAAREGRAIDIPTVPETQLEERVAFLASVLLPLHFNVYSVLPPVHNGLTVRYVLDREFYFTNPAEQPGALAIDFGYNPGVRTVRFGETVVITYAHEGAQHLQVWASLSGQRLLAEFTVQVRDTSAIRPPDDTWTLMADIPYDGQEATGQAYILYGTEDGARHGSLVNPIIIADGFPGHPYEEIYDQLNKQGFLSSVLGRGYDIVLLTYTNGSDLIQRNAFLAVKCIQTVIHNRTGDQRLIVGGASMGGIVTRYALAYMEKNGLDHQTAPYPSFDSPHRCAYVPVSVRHLVRVFAEYSGTAEAKHN